MRLLLKLKLLTLLVATNLFANPQFCLQGVLDDISVKNYQPAKIAKWSMDKMDLFLRPEQILPAAYLKQLKLEGYEVILKTKSLPDSVEVKLTATHKNDILRLSLFENVQDPKTLMIDNLSLKDPLNVGVAKLNASQSEKGLPLAIVAYIKRQFYEIAKAGGYTKIGAAGTQNYLVTLFYLRSIGMKPVDKKSHQLIEFCHELYQYARKHLPEDLRPTTLDQFAKMLGGHDFKSLDKRSELIFLNYGNFKTLPAGVSELKDSNNNVIGFINRKEIRSGFSKVYFIDKMAKYPRLFEWENYSVKRFPQLELELK